MGQPVLGRANVETRDVAEETDSMKAIACVDIQSPTIQSRAFLRDAALVLGGSIVLALSAQIAVPMWPVPATAQTLAVVLLGALLGSRRAPVAVLAYLAQGANGLPVFANGGVGPFYMLGPTGGYLLGFVGAAWLVGRLVENGWGKRMSTTLAAMFLGHVVLFACGLVWLSTFVGATSAVAVGLTPFIPGCVLKVCLATALLPHLQRLTSRHDEA
jgi:biotin transport system substrate-specific component